MSSSSSGISGGPIPLAIDTDSEAWITIFDGFDRLCNSPRRGKQTVALLRGIYTVRCERGGQTREKTILHNDRQLLFIQPPAVASAVPIEGASTTHEYYHYPCEQWSVMPTSHLPGQAGDGGIFLFIRAWDREHHEAGRNLAAGFSLLEGTTGRLITDLGDPSVTARDENFGFAAFCASIRPGFYQLRYLGPEAWAMPVHVFPGRATQIFIMFHHKPLIGNVRVFYRRVGERFRWQDTEAIDLDLALTNLGGGNDERGHAIPVRRENELLQGNFKDPMLGLVGAHWLVSRPQSGREQVEQVLHKLRTLIPDSPDVAALEMLAAARWPRPFPAPVGFPPVLAAGLKALLARPDQAIEAGSFLERILVRRQTGSPWVTWEPERNSHARVHGSVAPVDSGDAWVQRALLEKLSNTETSDAAGQVATELALPRRVVRNALANLQQAGESGGVRVEFRASAGSDPVPVSVDKAEDWTWRAAVLLDEPFPRVNPERGLSIPLTSPSGTIRLPGRRPVAFESGTGQGGFRIFEDRQLLLAELDGTGKLAAAIPADERVDRYILFRWDHDVGSTMPGDAGLGTDGPAFRGPARNYALAFPFARYWGGQYALQSALSHWRLPLQISNADDLAPGEVICTEIPGSFRLRFRTMTRLQFVDASGTGGGTGKTAIEVEASAGGVFRLVISRQSPDAAERRLQFRVFEPAMTIAPVVSVNAAPIGGGGESAWSAGQYVNPAVWPEIRQAVALASARQYSQTLLSELSRRSRGPLIDCELDFGENGETCASQLRDLLAGEFDRNRTELSGELISIAEEGVELQVQVAGDASSVTLSAAGDIVVGSRTTTSAAIKESLATQAGARPLRSSLWMPFADSSPAFLRMWLRMFLERFSLTGGDGGRVEALFSRLRNGRNDAVAHIELKWPDGIGKSWGTGTDPEISRLQSRLRAELRFWRPLLDLANRGTTPEFIVYGALPADFDPRTKSMEVSFAILELVQKSSIGLLNATGGAFSVPGFLKAAENSAVFRALLEFEDRVCDAASAIVRRQRSLESLLPVIDELPQLRVSEKEALQTILFGGGALQLAGDADLRASAAIDLTVLNGGAEFPPPGFPLHADPPLSSIVAQLRLEQLIDALKPTAAAKVTPRRSEEPGAAANYAEA